MGCLWRRRGCDPVQYYEITRETTRFVGRCHFSPRFAQPSQAASVARSEWQHERGSQSVTISRPAFAFHGCAMYFVGPPRCLSSPVRVLEQPYRHP